MQINKLPDRLREMALRNRRTIGFPGAEAADQQSLWLAFPWKDSPEGAEFWDYVDEGKFHVAVRIFNKQNHDAEKAQAGA